MSFLENIFSRLQAAPDRAVLAEAHVGGMTPSGEAASGKTSTGADLLGQIALARAFLRAAELAKGDRCALIAPNTEAANHDAVEAMITADLEAVKGDRHRTACGAGAGHRAAAADLRPFAALP